MEAVQLAKEATEEEAAFDTRLRMREPRLAAGYAAMMRIVAAANAHEDVDLFLLRICRNDTHNKFETTDQREWMFTCPHCGKEQAYAWSCIEWSKDSKDAEGNYDFRKVRATTYMRCAHCQAMFEDRDDVRLDLNARSRFVPQNPNAATEYVGFHWNALATMSWGMLAELYLRAKTAARKGDYTQLQQFYQKRLAEAWNEFHEDFHVETPLSDYRLGDFWADEGNIGGVPLRFLTVDVQRECFYAVVRAWALNGSSRLMYCDKLHSWDDIAVLAARFGVQNNLVFIDCGYQSYEVYGHCAENGRTALMGDKRTTFTHRQKDGKQVKRLYSPKRRINLGHQKVAEMYFWSNLNVKDALFRLRHNTSSPLWEIPGDAPRIISICWNPNAASSIMGIGSGSR